MLATFLILINCVYEVVSIQYVQGRWFELVWIQEKGSLWRPKPPPGYHSLGDVVQKSRDQPKYSTLFVRPSPNEIGALVAPLRANVVWQSGDDFTIYKLEARYGYQCLGLFALPGYVDNPDISSYRCVNQTYLQNADQELIWKDTVTYPTASLIAVVSVPDSGGVTLNHLMIRTYRYSGSAWTLDMSKLQPGDLESASSGSAGVGMLSVKKVEKTSLLWSSLSDSPSDHVELHNPEVADRDIRRGYHIMGTSLKKKDYYGSNYIVSGSFGRSIAYPLTYKRVWDIKITTPLYLWEANCPQGFSHIGVYATISDIEPSNETVCVNSKLLFTLRNWRLARIEDDFTTFWIPTQAENGLQILSFNIEEEPFAPEDNPITLDKNMINILPKVYVEKYTLYNVKLKPVLMRRIKRTQISDYTFKTPVSRSINPYSYLQDRYNSVKWNGRLTTTSIVDNAIPLDIKDASTVLLDDSQWFDRIIKSALSQVDHFTKHVSQQMTFFYLYGSDTKYQLQAGERTFFTYYEEEIMIDVPYEAFLSVSRSDDSETSEFIEGNLNIQITTVTYNAEVR